MADRKSPWYIRYGVYYILTWMLISFILMFISYDISTPVFPQWVGYLMITGLAFPVCRYTSHTLTPRYLYQRKIGSFIGYILLYAAINAIFTYLIAGFIYHLLTGNPIFRSFIYVFTLLFEMFLIDIILVAISCIIKIIKDRYFMEQQMLEIEKEKVTTELNFLRSQVNPHFLFNVMNTIYFQIEKKNVDARLSIEKFSEMLRYQLYECVTDKIQIEKELHYIRNYVAIQTLRMEKDSDIILHIDEGMESFQIAPLLILPIVENAFKHVSNFKDAEKNKIHLTIKNPDGRNLLIEAVNTYDQLNGQKHLVETGGLGIQNLMRRLELLYPGRHELRINKEINVYQTTLTLQYGD